MIQFRSLPPASSDSVLPGHVAPSHASESCALAHWAGTASRLAVFAANRAAHACFPRSGQRRKKSESTLRRHPASLSRSHSRRSAQSVSWTCFSSVCFAQSRIMLTRFFESGAQKTESIIAFNCSVRRSVSFRSKRSPRHSSLETGANVAARLKLRGKAELKTHRDAYDEHCIQRRHPAPTSVPCQVNCQWRYRRPVHILSYVKIMTPFDLTTARGLRPRDG